MEAALELLHHECLTASPNQHFSRPAAYQLLDQAKHSLENLRDEAAHVHNCLCSVENDLRLLARKEEGEAETEMSLLSNSEDIDGLFAQVKKAVFVVDAQIESFCFKHKSAYSERERKKAVTSALEKMANDIWTALIAAAHKPPKVQLAEARQTISSLHIRAAALTKGLTASLESIEDVLFGHLKEGTPGLKDKWDTLKSTPNLGEVGSLHSGKEELAAELQEEGLRMLSSFEKYASVRGGRSTSVTAVRREMNLILKDMVATVQLHCAGLGPHADAETWKMKKQAVRIKNRISSLCKDLEERQASVLWENSMSASTCHVGRDLPSFDAERSTPSFDSPDRNIRSRCPSTEPSFKPSSLAQQSPTRSRSERLRSAVTQAHSLHARQQAINVDVEEIRSKLSGLFPASRLHATTALATLKTLAPQLAACGDHEFIELFAQQVRTERQEEANLLATLKEADLPVLSLKEAGEEILRLKGSLQCLREEYDEHKKQTTLSLRGSERDKDLLKQLEGELKQLKERGKGVAAATQTGPAGLSMQTMSIPAGCNSAVIACVNIKEVTEPPVLQVKGIPGKSSGKERRASVKGTNRPIPRKLTTVQEAVECMEHEEEPSSELKVPRDSPPSPLQQQGTSGSKTLLRLPMSYFKAKAMSRDAGSLSAGKLPLSIQDLVEKRTTAADHKGKLLVSSSEHSTQSVAASSPVSKSVTPPRKKVQPEAVPRASLKDKSLTAWSVSELKGKKTVIREPVLRRNESRSSGKSAPKACAVKPAQAEEGLIVEQSVSTFLETVPVVPPRRELSALRQLIAVKVEELQSIAEEEAVLEAERASLSSAALEEQYIEAKLAEWAAFPDLFRLGRVSQDLCRAHRRYDQVFSDIQSLEAEIQALQTQSLTLLPVPSLWTAPGQVCGRVQFEAWEWTLVKLEGTCFWVRSGVGVSSVCSAEMVAKYLESTELLTCRSGLPGDLVQALAQVLNSLPNTSI